MPLALFYAPYRLRAGALVFRNLMNTDARKILSMSFGPNVIFTAFLLEDRDGSSTALVDDGAHHRDVGYDWSSDDRSILFPIEQDSGPLERGPLFPLDSLDIKKVAGSDSILFSTCFNDRICHNGHRKPCS